MYVMTLHRSTIGKKVIMAVTGLIGIGFVFLHMYGNLKAFWGAEYFNEYAEGLRILGVPIFGHLHLLVLVRAVLVVAVILHTWAAWSLYRQAETARPRKYVMHKKVQANYPALTMRWGGLAIFLFLIYHLMHLTWGMELVNPDFVRTDPYHNLVSGLAFWPVSFVYMIAVIALGLHLYHGAWSMFQTLGLSDENTSQPLHFLSVGLALFITIGYLTVPLAILAGIIHE